MKRAHRLSALLLIMALLFGLAACGGEPDTRVAPSDDEPETEEHEEEQEEEPEELEAEMPEVCEHEWLAATCSALATCTLCGETDGAADPDAHEWSEATCTAPVT